jgi:hypothetical protein
MFKVYEKYLVKIVKTLSFSGYYLLFRYFGIVGFKHSVYFMSPNQDSQFMARTQKRLPQI